MSMEAYIKGGKNQQVDVNESVVRVGKVWIVGDMNAWSELCPESNELI